MLVGISDLQVIAGEARPAQIAEVLAWAREYRESLALKWAELASVSLISLTQLQERRKAQ